MRIIRNTIVLTILLSGILIASTTVSNLGNHPFHQPSLISVEDLISMVQDNKVEVIKGFDRAGASDLFDAFFTQLPDAEIVLTEFPKGSTFEWMFMRKNGDGDVAVIKDIVWGNDSPFSGYQFPIEHDGTQYDFVVPLICGNISLLSSNSIAGVPVIIAPIPLAEKPECKENEAWNKDTESCDCVDGYNRDENGICIPIVAETEVGDDDSQINPAIAAAPIAAGLGALKLLGDLGYLHQFDPAHHLFGRIGAEIGLAEKFSLLGLVGYAPHIGGSDGISAFTADILGEYKFGKAFVNLGIGGWITKGDDDIPMENTQIDLIGAFGSRIFGEPDDFNISLFLETRQGLNELGSMHEIRSFGRYGGGLRFRF